MLQSRNSPVNIVTVTAARRFLSFDASVGPGLTSFAEQITKPGGFKNQYLKIIRTLLKHLAITLRRRFFYKKLFKVHPPANVTMGGIPTSSASKTLSTTFPAVEDSCM